jgi:hypothetical protein
MFVRWIPTNANEADMFTKNLFDGPLYVKFATVFVREDKYL